MWISMKVYATFEKPRNLVIWGTRMLTDLICVNYFYVLLVIRFQQ